MTTTGGGSPVREQYESFPYPPRDPARELDQLRSTLVSQLALANHAIWGGARRMGSGFRVLDAGCGTGDNTVFAAYLLRGSGAEVVGLDLSDASLEITGARCRARGLDGVRLIRGQIEEVASLGLGTFDYIISAGVLHHLPSPEAGLQALVSVLKPGGGLGLMVYGLHGRTAVYQLQALLKLLAPPSLPAEERLRRARTVLGQLGPNHWANLARASWQAELDLYGDAGLFDLLLHSTDRAYTVPQVHAWLASAGLRLVRFDAPLLYEPEMYSKDPALLGHLTPEERQATAELLHGHMAKHAFFAARAGDPAPTPPAPTDERAIPTWLNADASGALHKQLEAGRLSFGYESLQLEQVLEPAPRALLLAVDDKKAVGAILDEVSPQFPAIPRAQLLALWGQLVEATSLFGLVGMFPA
jgi:SAM-dependent methyltransferase